jgi:hypothetical protein
VPLRFVQAAGCLIVVTLEGEGERCQHFPNSFDADINGTSECQYPLVCVAAFNIGLYPYDRCCPADLENPANVPACYSVGNVGGTPDATAEGSTVDGPAESSRHDGPAAEGATDAEATDAPSDVKGRDASDAKSAADAPAKE